MDEVANSRQRRSEQKHGHSLPEVPQLRCSTCEQAADAEPQRCSSPQAGQAAIGGRRAMPATPDPINNQRSVLQTPLTLWANVTAGAGVFYR